MQSIAGCIGAVLGGSLFQNHGAVTMWFVVLIIFFAAIFCNFISDGVSWYFGKTERGQYQNLDSPQEPASPRDTSEHTQDK